MELKRINAPAISQEGVARLRAFARQTRLTSSSTTFDAGYEQCKADLRNKLDAEVADVQENLFKQVTVAPTRAAPATVDTSKWWHW